MGLHRHHPPAPQLSHSRLSKPPAQHPTPPKLLHRQPRSLLPLPPSQTLPHHQVPLIGHLHRHHPPAPSSLILGALSLSPSTRHHPSSCTGNLRPCSPSLPPRPSPTTRYHSLGTSTDTTLQPPSSLILGSLSLPPSTRHHPSPLHRQPRSLLPLPPSQTLTHHQVPLIGHLHRHRQQQRHQWKQRQQQQQHHSHTFNVK